MPLLVRKGRGNPRKRNKETSTSSWKRKTGPQNYLPGSRKESCTREKERKKNLRRRKGGQLPLSQKNLGHVRKEDGKEGRNHSSSRERGAREMNQNSAEPRRIASTAATQKTSLPLTCRLEKQIQKRKVIQKRKSSPKNRPSSHEGTSRGNAHHKQAPRTRLDQKKRPTRDGKTPRKKGKTNRPRR